MVGQTLLATLYNDFSSSANTGMVLTVNMDPSDFVAVHDVEKLPHRVQEGRRQPRERRRLHFHCRESRGHLTPSYDPVLTDDR